MLPVDGAFLFSEGAEPSVENGTQVDLNDAGVLHRAEDGSYSVAWIGELNAKTSANSLSFREVTGGDLSVGIRSIWYEQDEILSEYHSFGHENLEPGGGRQ